MEGAWLWTLEDFLSPAALSHGTRQVRPRIVLPRSQRNSIKSQDLIAVSHSFCLIHIARHSSIPFAEVSSICPYCSSFSVKDMEIGEGRGPPLKCRAEIRIRACLTASRRATELSRILIL
jgi:hypothetical protein